MDLARWRRSLSAWACSALALVLGSSRRLACRCAASQRRTSRRHSGSWQYRWFQRRGWYLRSHPLFRQGRAGAALSGFGTVLSFNVVVAHGRFDLPRERPGENVTAFSPGAIKTIACKSTVFSENKTETKTVLEKRSEKDARIETHSGGSHQKLVTGSHSCAVLFLALNLNPALNRLPNRHLRLNLNPMSQRQIRGRGFVMRTSGGCRGALWREYVKMVSVQFSASENRTDTHLSPSWRQCSRFIYIIAITAGA